MNTPPLPDALEAVRDITDRAKAMGLGLILYPVDDVEAMLLALEDREEHAHDYRT